MLTKKERWLFYHTEGNLSPKQRILCTWRNLCGESAILIIHIKSVTLKWNDFNRNEEDQNYGIKVSIYGNGGQKSFAVLDL